MEDLDKAATARGFSVVLNACAELFLNEPTDQVLADIHRVAATLGTCGFDTDSDQTQRYYDRLFITASPLYVPLVESCIARGGLDENGNMQYASVDSSLSDHVLGCYEAVGYDYKALEGYELAVSGLRVDSLAAELAFLAFCTQREATSWELGDNEQATHWNQLARQFAREHVGTWIGTAAACLATTSDDLYARGCRLAADTVASLQN